MTIPGNKKGTYEYTAHTQEYVQLESSENFKYYSMWSRKNLFPLKNVVFLKNVNSMRKLVSKTSSGALRVRISHKKTNNPLFNSPKRDR